MFGFLNRRPGRLEYQVPLQEARLAELFPPQAGIHSAACNGREDEIRAVDKQVLRAWHNGERALADRLLDMRNAIRPARPAPVPVIPGRTS